MKRAHTLILLILFMAGCTTSRQQAMTAAQQAFLQKFHSLCGQQFQGKVVYPEGDKNPFAGKPLLMYVEQCNKAEIKVPFWVGEDRSRTWIFTATPQGLLFKHDHRHKDGTPDSITNYGGYARGEGSALEQHFPADAFTANLIPAAATNEWIIQFSEDGQRFSYSLQREEQLRFKADFDLTKPATAAQETCIDSSRINPDVMCIQLYKPVCGCDGKTYGNACVADNSGVRRWTEGECPGK